MDDEPIPPIDDWAAAARVRKARRAYQRKRPVAHDFAALERHCATFTPFEGVRVVAVEQPSVDVFVGVLGRYGKVSDAPSVLLFIGEKSTPDVAAKIGYVGEAAVLEATRLGFATCWVSGFFSRRKVRRLVDLGQDEKVFAVTPVGYAVPETARVERVMQGVARSHVRRQLSELAPGVDSGLWPRWAFEGVVLARMAPSGMNAQPWRFRLEDGTSVVLTASEKDRRPVSHRRLDCGIAMLHFELGALTNGGVGGWEFLGAPDVARYRLAEVNEEAAADGDA
jgi:hypothetical protein